VSWLASTSQLAPRSLTYLPTTSEPLRFITRQCGEPDWAQFLRAGSAPYAHSRALGEIFDAVFNALRDPTLNSLAVMS
jgi:hypothetical protein